MSRFPGRGRGRGGRGRGARGRGRSEGGGGGLGRGRGRSFSADGGGFGGRAFSPRGGGGGRRDGRAPSARGRGGRAGSAGRGSAPPAKRAREGGSDSDDEAPLQLGDGSAYDALLASLQRGGGAAAAALERRAREIAGESEGDDGSSDDEDEGEEEEGDEDEAEEGEEASGSEEGASEEADDDEDDVGDEDDEAAPAFSRPAAASGGDDELDAPPASGDAWSARVERVLSDAEAEAARARAAAPPAWRDAGPAPLPAGCDGATWQLDSEGPLPAERPGPAAASLPAALLRRWAAVHGAAADAAPPGWDSPAQRSLFSLLESYRDVAYTARRVPSAPLDAMGGGDDVMDACLLHALGHVLKARSRVLHNNDKLRKRAQAARAARAAAKLARASAPPGAPPPAAPVVDDDAGDVPQDQGFARPKVLVLLPLRSYAMRWVTRLLALTPAANTGAADAVSKLERFQTEYGPRPDEAGPDPRPLRGKPPDFRALFAGNRDDHFRLGIKLTRRSVRLFADFAGADVLVASPLGLATRLEAGDAAFLSSIELVVADGCDVFAMQNWAHVQAVFAALNGVPAGEGGAMLAECDIMRVRPWYLQGWGALYRQTVLLSAYGSPALASLCRAPSCQNAAGRARLRQAHGGSLGGCAGRATQAFARVVARSAADVADARFAHFKARVWPRLRESRGGELLFVPSYFDFVRLRNFLKAADASFVANSEYADASEVGRGRAAFSAGEARIMLYSERAHFFRRHVIRGARRLTFYAPPERADFYAELVAGLEQGPEPADVTLLFTRWDAPALERLVGSGRAQKMLKEVHTPSYVFC